MSVHLRLNSLKISFYRRHGTYRLATAALADNRDVLFFPVDLLHIGTFSELKAELEISHDLGEILANWPGPQPGLLIVDALDAARKPETQTVLRDVIAGILRVPKLRWNVIASVRSR
jgi:hypothetical protein